MSQLYQFGDLPPEPIRLALCEWLRHHGIDPNEVCAGGWIERRPEARQIAYEAYARNERNEFYLNEDRDDAVREVRVVQLKAEPSPFPGVLVT